MASSLARTLGIALALATPTVLFAFGCADSERTADADGSMETRDSGPAFRSDMAPNPGVDAGAAADQGPPNDDDFAGLPAPEADASGALGEVRTGDPGTDARSCYDGADNDGDLVDDCADSSCFGLATCCLDSSRDACCTAPEMLVQASFDACADPDTCVVGATLFGAPRPFVADGALAMGGDGLYDSGVLLDEAVDLRSERLELRGTFQDTTSCTGCLDGAAFGITARTSLDDQAHVQALVALQRNAGSEALLRIGDRVALRIPVTDGAPFTLILRPDGEGEVRHDGATHLFTHGVRRTVRGVAWGYSSNPSATATETVTLDDFSAHRARCPMSAGWRGRDDIGPASGDLTRVSAVSDPDGAVWVLLDSPGGPEFGVVETDGTFTPRALEIGASDWAAAPRDWALTHDGTDLWLTFLAYGAGQAMGRAVLVGDTFEPEDAPFFVLPRFVDAPRWIHALGHDLVVAETAAGIELFGRGPRVPTPLDGGEWTVLPTDLGDFTEGARHPDLVLSPEGTWLLHYARQVGTRWVVELAASDELVAWRPLDTVLQGSGDLDSVDGLGVSSPSAVSMGDRLTLFYRGHAPAGQALARVDRWLGASR